MASPSDDAIEPTLSPIDLLLFPALSAVKAPTTGILESLAALAPRSVSPKVQNFRPITPRDYAPGEAPAGINPLEIMRTPLSQTRPNTPDPLRALEIVKQAAAKERENYVNSPDVHDGLLQLAKEHPDYRFKYLRRGTLDPADIPDLLAKWRALK